MSRRPTVTVSFTAWSAPASFTELARGRPLLTSALFWNSKSGDTFVSCPGFIRDRMRRGSPLSPGPPGGSCFQTRHGPSLWHRAVSSVHGWHGHVMRHPDSLAARAASWRSLMWWRVVQVLGFSRYRTYRHPRRGWTRGAEVLFERCLGADFLTLAVDRQRWLASQPRFLTWCVETFGVAHRRLLPRVPPPGGAEEPRRSLRLEFRIEGRFLCVSIGLVLHSRHRPAAPAPARGEQKNNVTWRSWMLCCVVCRPRPL